MKKILLIEDDAAIRETVSDALEFADFEVRIAMDGREGVQIAREHLPDLILCDIMMPHLDGYGVLQELQQQRDTSAIPFIFLTAKARKDDIRQGMILGADDYIVKPFSAPELLESVNTRFARHQKLSEVSTQVLDETKAYLNLYLPHELRTPLNIIMGYLSMLMELSDEHQYSYDILQRMNSATLRLYRLIQNYLLYAQLSMFQSQDDNGREDLAILNRICSMEMFVNRAQHEAEEAQRVGDLNLEVEPARVGISSEYLDKIAQEILNNAFKFSDEGSPVSVVGRFEDSQYVIEVTNYGRGMSAEEITNIGATQQFKRLQYEQQGSGLGLAICQKLLEIHNGTLQIESITDDYLTARIFLPLVTEFAATQT